MPVGSKTLSVLALAPLVGVSVHLISCSSGAEGPADPSPAASTPSATEDPSDGQTPPPPPAKAVRYGFEIVATYPHDAEAYTQGLIWHEGFLYESTGQYLESSLRRVDLASGTVLRSVSPQPEPMTQVLFAEGLERVGDELYQLTWTSGRVIVWGLEDFDRRREYRIQSEGWGLCTDGEQLILSNGSSKLLFFDPVTMRQTAARRVTLDGRPIDQLNELEFIAGEVWANVWQEDFVLRIEPGSGRVTGVIDFAGLIDLEPDIPAPGGGAQNVLNGIAHDPETGRIFVTGKDWPALFEVRIVPENQD